MFVLIIRNRLSKLNDKEFAEQIYRNGFPRINSNISRKKVYKVLSYDIDKQEFDRCFYLSGIDIDNSGNTFRYVLSKVKPDDEINDMIGRHHELLSCLPYQVKSLEALKEG